MQFPQKILRLFFTGLGGGKKKNPRIHMEPQRLQKAKAVLRRKNTTKRIVILRYLPANNTTEVQ